MAKKEKIELTPEERLGLEETKKAKRKIFGETFLKACALFLAVVLVYSVTYVAIGGGRTVYEVVQSGPVGGGAASVNSNNPGSAQSPDANAPASDEASAAATAINEATKAAADAGYDWARKCDLEKIDVGNATDTINGIIKRVDPNADLNSVVGGFIGRGDKKNTNTKGADPKEIFGNANYKLKATSLQAGDLQGLKVEGDTYTFKLADASNPQKDGGTSLNRLTDDFITQDEVAQGIKDGLGALSALVSVKSSDVVFQNIEVTVVIKEGKLESLSYKYDMVVNKLALNVATGVGNGYVDASYSNFVY